MRRVIARAHGALFRFFLSLARAIYLLARVAYRSDDFGLMRIVCYMYVWSRLAVMDCCADGETLLVRAMFR